MFFFLTLLDDPEEQQKFTEIYYQYRHFLWYVANQKLQDAHLAEDAVQEAFLALTRHMDKIEDVHSDRARNFLATIVRSKAVDILRKKVPEAELPQEAAKPAEPVEEPPEDLTVMDEATGVEDTVPAMESETDAQPVAPRLVVAPLVGEEVAAFSVDELTYNETLGDWRTHDGIDIAAEVGTQVIAACSGVVTAVRDDDMMGTLVTIAHDDGYETTYANLRSSPGVGEGQYVSAGEVIGAVGSSSIAEFSMPAHLHFSVSKDGVPCDPAEFLN